MRCAMRICPCTICQSRRRHFIGAKSLMPPYRSWRHGRRRFTVEDQRDPRVVARSEWMRAEAQEFEGAKS
jgi:hypothetical protein